MPEMNAGKPIRVGVIGAGWGAIVHGPAVQAVEDYELVAICGRSDARTGKAGESLGIIDTSTDWEAFVARPDLDVISIATPVTEHHRMAVAALAHGKHVLCEKPMSLTVAEASDMCVAAERNGLSGAICFEYRWSQPRMALRSLIRSGMLGQLRLVRVSHSYNHWHPAKRPQSDWMYRQELGGGYLNGVLSHDIDFLISLLGPPLAVCADVRTTVDEVTAASGQRVAVTADDTTGMLIRFSTGVLAIVSISATGRVDTGGSMEVTATDGTAIYRYSNPADGKVVACLADSVEFSDAPAISRAPRSGYSFSGGIRARAGAAMACMLEDWVPALSGLPSEVPTFESGLLVQRVIEAAQRSSEGEGWVLL